MMIHMHKFTSQYRLLCSEQDLSGTLPKLHKHYFPDYRAWCRTEKIQSLQGCARGSMRRHIPNIFTTNIIWGGRPRETNKFVRSLYCIINESSPQNNFNEDLILVFINSFPFSITGDQELPSPLCCTFFPLLIST